MCIVHVFVLMAASIIVDDNEAFSNYNLPSIGLCVSCGRM